MTGGRSETRPRLAGASSARLKSPITYRTTEGLIRLAKHGLLDRDGKRYAYRLTGKGTKVALLFVLFHKQLCGPLANSLFHHQPDPDARPKSKLESAYHKADASIRNVIQLLEAA